MDQSIPYERLRNPNLPWGYWLTSVGETQHGPPLCDEQGRQWHSVREALWVSRFHMAPFARDELMHQELEFLLAILVAIDRRVIGTEERALDHFDSWDCSRFYGAWIHGQNLIEPDPGCSLDGQLTPEGRAILVMLASTRRAEEQPLPIGLPTLRRWHGLNAGADEERRRTVIAAQEAAAEHLRFRFTCEQVGCKPALVLLGDGLGPNMPIRRKLWSMTFLDTYARDRMYLWLHERLDRWPEWGERAYRSGARSLSEHLLQVRFCDEPVELG